MNAELVAMFLSGIIAHVMLVGAGFAVGLLARGRPRYTLWHGTACGIMGGYAISLIFAGQFGVFNYRVTPMLSVTTFTDLFWLYDLTAVVAFFGIVALVVVDVLIGALAASVVYTSISDMIPQRSEA
jgi:hypothetical protein